MASDNELKPESGASKKRKRTIPLWLLLAIIVLVGALLGYFFPFISHPTM